MSGASGCSSVGAVYVVTDPKEPRVSIRQHGRVWHVCVCDDGKLAEIVAEVGTREHAEIVAAGFGMKIEKGRK